MSDIRQSGFTRRIAAGASSIDPGLITSLSNRLTSLELSTANQFTANSAALETITLQLNNTTALLEFHTSDNPKGFNSRITALEGTIVSGAIIIGTPNEIDVVTNGNEFTLSLPDAINVSQINFNTATVEPTLAEGQLSWDNNYETLLLGYQDNVSVALGQSLFKRVYNQTANTISKGNVVYIKGAHAQSLITVEPANANAEATAAGTLGVAAMDIISNSSGWVITQGYLRGISTNGFSSGTDEGKIIWLSTTTGQMTVLRPTAPNHGVVVGYLIKSAGGGAGSIFVKVVNGQELDELHDVLIVSKSNNDILQWDANDLRWENRSLATAGIADKIHTHVLSDVTNLTQMTLVGRWASAGTGTAQPVTIGTGLKLSTSGVLSTNSLQVVDTGTIITAGNGLLGGGDLTQNRTFSVNFAANGEVSSVKAVRADDSRLSGLAPSTGLFDIDGGDSTVYTGTPILDGGVA